MKIKSENIGTKVTTDQNQGDEEIQSYNLIKTNLSAENFLIYLPKHTTIPTQNSPLCYFFTYLHLLAMHEILRPLPGFVNEIVSLCKNPNDDFRIIMYKVLSIRVDELLWIADEIIDSQDDENEKDWLEDFLDRYGVDFGLAKLMQLTVSDFENENLCLEKFTIDQLKALLEKYGPIALSLTHGIDFTENQIFSSKMVLEKEIIKTIYNVDNYANIKIPHCLLLIGCRSLPTPQVYLLDPNYPQYILAMSFALLKDKILMTDFVYFRENKLTPHTRVSFEQGKNDILSSKLQAAKGETLSLATKVNNSNPNTFLSSSLQNQLKRKFDAEIESGQLNLHKS